MSWAYPRAGNSVTAAEGHEFLEGSMLAARTTGICSPNHAMRRALLKAGVAIVGGAGPATVVGPREAFSLERFVRQCAMCSKSAPRLVV
jgi:hypothetical protein